MTIDNLGRGDICWAKLEPVEGSEQGGSRPVLIISNNLMNEHSPLVIAVPMTRAEEKVKAGPFNIPFEIQSFVIIEEAIQSLEEKGHTFAKQNGIILCNHARSISKTRIIEKLGTLSNRLLIQQVETALVDSFALDACDVCDVPLRPYGLACRKCGKFHKTRCVRCNHVLKLSYSFCPICGKGVN